MKKLAILWIWAALLWGGCDDFLTSRDKSQVLEKELFTDREGVEDALYGIYSGLAKSGLYGAEVAYRLDLLAQFYTPYNTSLYNMLKYEFSVPDMRSFQNDIWKGMYRSISDINNFLDNLDAMVEQAFDDQCTGANPRYPLMSEIKEMYLKAYYGK